MEPYVRLHFGYQSGCDDKSCGDGLGLVYLGIRKYGAWVSWTGDFTDTWIASKIEATIHNILHHQTTPTPTWEEIIHGREEVHA